MEGLGCLLELLFEPLLWFVVWVILLPVTLVLATPGVLFLAFFGQGDYLTNVSQGYGRVVKFWERLGQFA